MSPELTLLGYLFRAPGYGYDLHKRISQDLGHVWHLSQSQAYAILKRLEKQGDITVRMVEQDKLPTKQLLHITPQGQERFLEWLRGTSGGSTRAIRMEFVSRAYFLRQYFPSEVRSAFLRQIEEAGNQVSRLEVVFEQMSPDDVFNKMSLEMRVIQLRQTVIWLEKWMVTLGVDGVWIN